MENNLSLDENSKSYIALVKERTTPETFHKFQNILVKFGQEPETMDRSTMVSEVTNLFTEHDHDLIEKFHYFLDYNRRPVLPYKKSVKIVMTSCVDFIEKVKRVLNDDKKFYDFLTVVCEFQQHMDVKRVEEEAFCLFERHPALELEFYEFLAEKIDRRRVQDMVVAKERKKKEAKDSTDRWKGRKFSLRESKMNDVEELMLTKDLGYEMMLRAKEGAERLIADNSGSESPNKEIKIACYFRGLKNVEFMRDELKFDKFFQNCKLLSEKSMKREDALFQSRRFVSVMEKGIEKLTENWTEKQKRFREISREIDRELGLTE